MLDSQRITPPERADALCALHARAASLECMQPGRRSEVGRNSRPDADDAKVPMLYEGYEFCANTRRWRLAQPGGVCTTASADVQ